MILKGIENHDITPNQAKELFDVIKGYRDNILAVDLLEGYKKLTVDIAEIKAKNSAW